MIFILKSILIVSGAVFGITVFLYPLSANHSEQRYMDVRRLWVSGVLMVGSGLALGVFGW